MNAERKLGREEMIIMTLICGKRVNERIAGTDLSSELETGDIKDEVGRNGWFGCTLE